MPVIPSAQARATRTPNGVMTTLASPTQGEADHCLWRVDATPGMEGPLHAFDTEVLWTWLDGSAVVELDGERHEVGPGDTMVLPAGVPRRMFADAERGFTAVAAAPPGAQAYNPGGVSDPDACDLAPKGDERTTPPWLR
ncbi:cupin domain-containing protein [Nonomuraea pusilla]|uniref:Cupin domain-containing protein n=1 Tax=Nonomuraea pusilla TaxID=46177 RepID=A0A1H8CUM2_9ACTN|nr:cupin domain-containing protein [Nonomuraea pusilla]SEM98144.1 Cupin domain-containing protein [Nonomuraea pusilla]